MSRWCKAFVKGMSPRQASAKRSQGGRRAIIQDPASVDVILSGRQATKDLARIEEHPIVSRSSSGLLLSHISDHRQLPHLSLIGFKQKNDPDHEARQSDQRPYQNGQPSKERDVRNEA